MICDSSIAASVKKKTYKMLVIPVTMCGLETVALTKRKMAKLEVSSAHFSLRVTRMERITEIQLRLSPLETKLERQG